MVAARLPFPLECIPTSPVDSKGRKGGAFGNITPSRRRPHRGVDFSRFHILRLKLSLNVRAVTAGVVTAVETRDRGELGRYVEIRDDEGFYWGYYHLQSVSTLVGRRVELGDVVGVVGSSGSAALAGAEHLHLTLSDERGGGINGRVFDPILHILARSSGVAGINITPVEAPPPPVEEEDIAVKVIWQVDENSSPIQPKGAPRPYSRIWGGEPREIKGVPMSNWWDADTGQRLTVFEKKRLTTLSSAHLTPSGKPAPFLVVNPIHPNELEQILVARGMA